MTSRTDSKNSPEAPDNLGLNTMVERLLRLVKPSPKEMAAMCSQAGVSSAEMLAVLHGGKPLDALPFEARARLALALFFEFGSLMPDHVHRWSFEERAGDDLLKTLASYDPITALLRDGCVPGRLVIIERDGMRARLDRCEHYAITFWKRGANEIERLRRPGVILLDVRSSSVRRPSLLLDAVGLPANETVKRAYPQLARLVAQSSRTTMSERDFQALTTSIDPAQVIKLAHAWSPPTLEDLDPIFKRLHGRDTIDTLHLLVDTLANLETIKAQEDEEAHHAQVCAEAAAKAKAAGLTMVVSNPIHRAA